MHTARGTRLTEKCNKGKECVNTKEKVERRKIRESFLKPSEVWESENELHALQIRKPFLDATLYIYLYIYVHIIYIYKLH